MKRGRGFVYSSDKGTAPGSSCNTGARRSHDSGQQSTSSYGRSPMKRKRSPEPLPLSSAGASKRSGNRGGLSSKIAKTDDPFQEDDELDDLGAAALEQYELTQRDPALGEHKRSPTPVSDPISHSPAHKSTSSTILEQQSRMGGATHGRAAGWHNPYRESVSSVQQPTVISETSASSESSEDYHEQIRQLQEQNYTKDGEVKVLRGEKERLMGELRKKDEQMLNIQSQLLSEKHTIQEQLTKEKDTLATKLQFRDQELQVKEQELMKLREKLEQQRVTAPTILSNTPSSSSAMFTPKMMSSTGSAQRSRPMFTAGKSEFLSTETFMPLSQMTSGDVTPVQVGQKRVKEEENEPPKKTSRRSSKSPSISPGSHSGGPATSGKLSSATTTSNSSSKLGDSSKKSTRIPSTNVHESGPPKLTSQGKASSDKRVHSPEFVLNAPSSMEPTGAQLLMLLVQRDLLKIPFSDQRLDVKQLSMVCPGEDNSSPTNSESDILSSMESQVKPAAESNSSSQDQKKLTGLLSLLHLEPTNNRPGVNLMPQFSSGESSASPSSEESLSDSMLANQIPPPSVTVAGPTSTPNGAGMSVTTTTPVRRSKLHLPKPHTLARTDLTRARTQYHQSSDLIKSHSASNSPYPKRVVLEDHNPVSLASSIDKDNLERSIAAMLRSADVSMETSSLAGFSSEARPFSFVSASCNQLGLGSSSSNSVISLLKQIGDIICQYYDDQLSKAQASNSNMSGFLVDIGSETLDASSLSSPKSSLGTSSTISSKTSSDLTCPLEGDQQLASQALDLLETLVTYSKIVREHILMQPPEFNIDSRPSSALDVHTGSSGEYLSESSAEKVRSTAHLSPTTLGLMKVSGQLGMLQDKAVAKSSPLSEKSPLSTQKMYASWRGIPLCQVNSQQRELGVSGKVWMRRENIDTATTDYSSTTSSSSHVTPLHIPPRGCSCGQLFPILLELPVPQWRESLENVNTSLRILSVLAEDCPKETLPRFSSLFHDDKLGHCLDKLDDPQLTLTTLQLLYHLVRSPAIAELLCLHNDVACLPLTCYQCLIDPVPNSPNSNPLLPSTNDRDIVFKIRLQIVRLVSRVLMLDNGVKVVFEKCGCSHELLKSLTALLNKLIDIPKPYYKLSQFSQHELLLVKELLSLMYLVSVYDPFFDTHREQCEYCYVFVLNKLSFLFSTAEGEQVDEAALVVELLEYCDEYEDSQEDDGGSGNEMAEGERDERKERAEVPSTENTIAN